MQGYLKKKKNSGPTTTTTGSEALLYVLYCNTRSRCIGQRLQVGHEWRQFKIFSLHVLRSVILKTKCVLTAKKLFKMHFFTYSYKKQFFILIQK